MDSAKKINQYIDEFNSINPDLKLTALKDYSIALRQRTNLLLENGGLGILLVLIFLSLFLNIRLAFWVAFSIPISFLGMLIFAGEFDITINLMSLFGMIVVIGILVDDGIVIAENICPVAEGGGARRVPKYNAFSNITLNASASYDPDGSNLSFEWTAPDGSITTDSVIVVTDLDPSSRYSKYTYLLKVMDDQSAISTDSVDVIFSYFSAPISPSVYAVASHARVLVSWDASSEASYDSLSGYADFEGYKLYRSTDSGVTWGGDDDKLYDFNGEFVGWKPYAQFDLNEEEDIYHCIYNHEYDCEIEDARQTIISGLDPLAPRFSLGINTGIEYSFVDSNVVDGVEYSYTVTAYDIGLAPFSMSYSEIDSSGIYTSDTLWSCLLYTTPSKRDRG